MKKLSLNAKAFQKEEVLTKSQLKKILGGDGSSDGSGPNPKVEACKDKKEGDACSFMYNGAESKGYCRSYAPNYVKHCSNLI